MDKLGLLFYSGCGIYSLCIIGLMIFAIHEGFNRTNNPSIVGEVMSLNGSIYHWGGDCELHVDKPENFTCTFDNKTNIGSCSYASGGAEMACWDGWVKNK